MTTLRTALTQSAVRYVRRALESYVKDEVSDFYIFGGLGLEHAVKAKLAGENPLFLAPDFRGMLELHRSEGDVDRLPSGTKTVGAREAFTRLSRIEPGLKLTLDRAARIVDQRNSEAHVGFVDQTQKRSDIVAFLRAVNALLKVDADEFWKPHGDLVVTILDEDVAEVTRSVKTRIAAAVMTVANRDKEWPSEQVLSFRQMAEARALGAVDGIEVLAIRCPACEATALVSGSTEETDVIVDWGDEGPESAVPELTFFAAGFECGYCHLVLEGDREFEAAGLQSSWLNTEADPDDWIAMNYADFDPGDM